TDTPGDDSNGSKRVLFVDTPWPSPRRTRPWLMTAVAVAALVVLVLALSPPRQDGWTALPDALRARLSDGPASRPETGHARRPDENKRAAEEVVAPVNQSPRQTALPTGDPVTPSPRDGRELAELVTRHGATVIALEQDVDLKRDEQLVF